MNKNFAIFDFDGCLVDSMKYWKNLASEYLHSQGVSVDLTYLNKKIEAMTLFESAGYFKDEFKLKDPIDIIYKNMVKMINDHYYYDVAMKDGVKTYLQRLADKNIRMCIASSSEKKLISKALSRLEIDKYFDFVVSNYDVKTGKDEPDIYYYCVDKFNSSIEETAVFEDALYAIKTAVKSGFYTVGVKDTYQAKDFKEIEKYADEIISDFNLAAKEI